MNKRTMIIPYPQDLVDTSGVHEVPDPMEMIEKYRGQILKEIESVLISQDKRSLRTMTYIAWDADSYDVGRDSYFFQGLKLAEQYLEGRGYETIIGYTGGEYVLVVSWLDEDKYNYKTR